MHKFSPDKAFILEDDGRYVLLQPEKTLRQFGLREGMTIVDIGAGTGILSFFACQAHAKRVYAIERTDTIHLAEELAKENGLDMDNQFQAMQVLNHNWTMNGYEPASKVGTIYEAVLAYRHAAFLASYKAAQ